MKKKYLLVISILALLIYSSCKDDKDDLIVPVKSITVDNSSLDLYLNTSFKLSATINPAQATEKEIVWFSNSPKIVTVSKDGKVDGLVVGKAKVFARSNNGKVDTCIVNVVPEQVNVESVNIEFTELTIEVEQEKQLKANVLPINATEKNIVWGSSDSSKATVDKDGKITGVSVGKVKIIASSLVGAKMAFCNITVKPKYIPIESVSFVKKNEIMVIGDKKAFKVETLPENAVNKKVTFTSSDEAIAKIDNEGNILAIAVGKVDIKVVTEDNNKEAFCKLTVIKEAIGLVKLILDKEFSVGIGGKGQLTLGYMPEKATYRDVIWTSSDDNILTVDEGGNIKGIKEGNATVMVKSVKNENIKAECIVAVNPMIKTITVEGPKKVIVGYKAKYSLNITPLSAAGNKVIWSLDEGEESLATISETGEVTGKAKGWIHVRAKAELGDAEDYAYVNVGEYIHAESVSFNEKEGTMAIGDKRTLEFKIRPYNVSNKNVKWESSNVSIAKVDDGGEITAITEGEVDIKVITEDGNKEAIYKLTVIKERIALKKLSLDNEISLNVDVKRKLSLGFIPDNATNKQVTWSSSESNIVTVDSKGNLKGISEGKATITVISVVDESIKAESIVTVGPKKALAESITITGGKDVISIGEKLILGKTILPVEAKGNEVEWTVDDETVAAISKDGELVGKAVGKVKVTATAVLSGVNDYFNISIVNNSVPVTSLERTKSWNELTIGEEKYIRLKVLPVDASNSDLKWKTSNGDIATVNSVGLVKAISSGNVVITAEAFGGIKLDINITIKEAEYTLESGFRISQAITISDRDNVLIPIDFFTKEDESKELTWTVSENSKIDFKRDVNNKIKVNYNDYPILELKEGAVTGDQATFTATRADGKTSSCVVTVNLSDDYAFVKYIFGGQKTLDVTLGEDKEIGFYAYPNSATNKVLKYFNLDDSVLTILEDGTIHPIKTGMSIITVFSLDSGIFEKCIVTVIAE